MSFNLVVVGSGISGSIVARELAEKGLKILLLEKREHIAGNIYDQKYDGITVHKYGPHIFHTDLEKVNNYMNKYWKLNNYKNKVEAKIKNKLVPIPFNFKGIDTFFGKNKDSIKQKLKNEYGDKKHITIAILLKSLDFDISEVALFIYKNVFENYTVKMWGVPVESLDPNIMKRIPISLSYSTRYFHNKYEGIPKNGYTSAIKNILNHPNITIQTNINALNRLKLDNSKTYLDNKLFKGLIIYSGPLDELLKFKYGRLPYRSLFIDFKTINKTNYQKTAVVNYPEHPKITRITEYKLMSNEVVDNKTIISIETPGEYAPDSKLFSTPYYPLGTKEAKNIYKKYLNYLSKYSNIIPIGRMATYKYLNMDIAALLALELSEKLIKDINNG